ncbi:Signal recognition particle 19 kDa protein, putative [Perkinsus marinus ATCC 50983]|uniref:Signal recognition particle 19 kDa protein, putative n=1 Tax=Perkinsus marinus (strain ATCC 50983 / TXsc) TaxID=423536 RepID=C5K7K8_PERM5|nr:Signal recognition particle 19 kDa protein, putative [Perkinsus marinus ATCC 50983]EER19543.1 Signal recognition particle 19 kDa protein, putative [Perkinsus marinus ATCC 50983]|mmetsp:Transcript_17240/g.17100  ORF Transcript_17240/g.17100 Transcript_17240/m.17100 type:complete len:163 (-) Transcript_17240:40-528(-)|eukprot:XP_002787747.1 Signal recognition particle 19 kDa protein, putative [Perkinsus marinus ATCC 50983]
MATQVLTTGSDGKQVDISRWNILYPNYLNAVKTVPEGRRIAKAKCVENPTVVEMGEACRELHIPCVLEDKCYPRDWLVRGRLRVKLSDDNGKPLVSEIPGKRQLLEKMGEVIPTLKSRTHPVKKAEENHHGKEAPPASSSAKAAATTTSHPHKSNKKRNKRK